jgi:hypothetical protein
METKVGNSEEHGNERSTAAGQACKRVVELYNSGNNCDKALLLAMQELLHIPPDHWDFSRFYSDKPDDSDRFLCKVLVAGAVAIYLDILSEGGIDGAPVRPGEKTSADRVVQVFNRFIIDCSGDTGEDPAAFDPFAHDPGLEGIEIPDSLRKEYTDRVAALFGGFKSEFPGSNCVDILGFDPFAYADYDEKIQEEIEKGEWMKQCIECMKHVISIAKTPE